MCLMIYVIKLLQIAHFNVVREERRNIMEEKKGNAAGYAETYGGSLGGALPLLTMIGAIIVFSLVGMRSVSNYWCAGFLGIAIGFIVYKDKDRYQKALMDGIGSPTFAMTVLILIVASVMGQVFTASHLGEGLLYALSIFNIPAAVVPFASFLVGAVISTASGSSSVVMWALVPVLFPVGVQMGCAPGLMLGAIVSGAVFGDNLAPISDSTITSALTQNVDVAAAVSTRVKYSVAALIPAALLFLVSGFMTTKDVAGVALSVDATYASSLLFLILPILLIVMILRKVNFLVALLIGDAVGIVMLFLYGFTDLRTVFSAEGVIVNGISGMLEAIVFMLFIFMILSLTQTTGVLEKFKEFMHRQAKTERAVETVAGLFICGICALTTVALSTMVFCGPIVRMVVEPFHIARTRTANYLGGLSNGLSMLLPYGAISVVVATLATSTGVVSGGMTPIDFIPFNFYCITLVAVYWIAILTGWGRDHEKV